jgi:hypothetical protein
VTDRHPESYDCVKAISPFRTGGSGVFRVAIHVRRGEQHALASDRMLPNDYYVACASQVVERLRALGIAFACELHTETPTKRFEVTPRHHGIARRIAGTVTYDPGMDRLEEFDVLPNLERRINRPTVETLRRLATADALIMSRSSFSYVAAILSPRGIAIYHPFWHSPMAGWVVAGADGALPADELDARLEAWRSAAPYATPDQNPASSSL